MGILEDYKKLIGGEDFFGGDIYDEVADAYDDTETFMTSKEIVQNKERLEAMGIKDNLPIEPPDIEEEIHFKRYTRQKAHKYTEKEMKAIKESCETTIVHDYGTYDIYHISDEERAKNDLLAELSMKLHGVKRVYRKVDEYVEAMRTVVEAWELLERNNYVHSRDEFFEMVADGTIISNRIVMPKLKKADQYSLDAIVKYISNPELDPKDLLIKDDNTRDPWYDQFAYEDDENYESPDEKKKRLLSAEEIKYIEEHKDDPEGIEVKDIKNKYIKMHDKQSQVLRSSKNTKKKYSKSERLIIADTLDILNKIQASERSTSRGDMYSRSYTLTHSLFEPKKKEKNMWDNLYFTGSWTNDDDVFLLDLITEEEQLKEHPPKEAYVTYADRELKAFFETLEKYGVSTLELQRRMNMSNDDVQKREIKDKLKTNKKLEAQIIQRITKLNNNPKFIKIVNKTEKALNNSN